MGSDEQHVIVGKMVESCAKAKKLSACLHQKTEDTLENLMAAHQYLARNREGVMTEDGAMKIEDAYGNLRDCTLPTA